MDQWLCECLELTGIDEAHFARFDGQQWQQLSGSANSTGVSNSTAYSYGVSLVASDRACVAWTESDSMAAAVAGQSGTFYDQIVMRCHPLR